MGYLIALVVVIVLIVAALAIVKKMGGLPGPERERHPFKKKDWLFSKAERSFFGVLKQAASSEFEVFAMVRLADVLWLPKGTPNAQGHRNRVDQKHVDFVLCEPKDIAPVLVIELDDASHKRQDRQERDALVDEILADAGLPILHVAVEPGYNVDGLRQAIRQKIDE